LVSHNHDLIRRPRKKWAVGKRGPLVRPSQFINKEEKKSQRVPVAVLTFGGVGAKSERSSGNAFLQIDLEVMGCDAGCNSGKVKHQMCR